MSRKIVRLTLDHLEALPAPCRSCLFWELDPVRRSRVEDPAAEKDAWISHVLREWGSCGRVALVDDVPVGYLVYAPEAFVPGAAGFPTAPVSPDAVLLTTAYVAPEHAGRRAGPDAGAGDGARPDQARHPGRRGVRRHPRQGPTSCVLPVEFLGSVGLQDPTGAQHHAADADGPPHRGHLADRGGGGAGAARRVRCARRRRRPAPKATRARQVASRTSLTDRQAM